MNYKISDSVDIANGIISKNSAEADWNILIFMKTIFWCHGMSWGYISQNHQMLIEFQQNFIGDFKLVISETV